MTRKLLAIPSTCLVLCLISSMAQSSEPVSSILSEAYRHIDAAASSRSITGYTAYDAPNFVTGIRGQINRAQEASIIGFQMKHAQWYTSKTNIRQITMKGMSVSVKTQVYQAFLATDQKPHGIREKFVFDLLNEKQAKAKPSS